MAAKHNRAVRRIANRYGACVHNPRKSPDIDCSDRRIEVKSTSTEIPKAIKQLGNSKKKLYVALPVSEHQKARQKLPSGIGLMDYSGKIRKRARRN